MGDARNESPFGSPYCAHGVPGTAQEHTRQPDHARQPASVSGDQPRPVNRHVRPCCRKLHSNQSGRYRRSRSSRRRSRSSCAPIGSWRGRGSSFGRFDDLGVKRRGAIACEVERLDPAPSECPAWPPASQPLATAARSRAPSTGIHSRVRVFVTPAFPCHRPCGPTTYAVTHGPTRPGPITSRSSTR
jgi:hypothetical protein